jgi:hypothetical protein
MFCDSHNHKGSYRFAQLTTPSRAILRLPFLLLELYHTKQAMSHCTPAREGPKVAVNKSFERSGSPQDHRPSHPDQHHSATNVSVHILSFARAVDKLAFGSALNNHLESCRSREARPRRACKGEALGPFLLYKPYFWLVATSYKHDRRHRGRPARAWKPPLSVESAAFVSPAMQPPMIPITERSSLLCFRQVCLRHRRSLLLAPGLTVVLVPSRVGGGLLGRMVRPSLWAGLALSVTLWWAERVGGGPVDESLYSRQLYVLGKAPKTSCFSIPALDTVYPCETLLAWIAGPL